jgi:hypothetical protein
VRLDTEFDTHLGRVFAARPTTAVKGRGNALVRAQDVEVQAIKEFCRFIGASEG